MNCFFAKKIEVSPKSRVQSKCLENGELKLPICLLCTHLPLPSPPSNKHFVEVNASVTIGIPFYKQQNVSICGLILCLDCLLIILYQFIFKIQYCIFVQFYFFNFPWNVVLNSFIMCLPGEHIIAPKWEIVFALLTSKSSLFHKPPTEGIQSHQRPPSDKAISNKI